MPDPGLVSRAQRAATMLERAWDRWRAAHGLAAEPLPPVSSYVGYSIEEPWGRPRVVFGVDAADAEKLATLLQDCAAPQPSPASRQAMDEARARIPAQGRTADLDETREQHSGAALEHSSTGLEHSSTEQSAGSANGAHPAGAAARPEDHADADDVQEGGATDFAVQSDSASEDVAGESAASAGTAADAPEGSPENLDLPVGQDDPVGQDGPATPDGSGSDQQELPAAADSQDPGESAVRKMQDASGTGDARNAGHGVTDTMVAELAGWAAGELPGQASARLAAWAAVGGTSARDGANADLRASSGAAEPII